MVLFTVESSMKNEPLLYGNVSYQYVLRILYELIYVVLWRCYFVCLFVLRKSVILREKNESLCCEHTDAKKGWLWSWHLLQNKEQQNEGLYFSRSKIKEQQLEPFIPSEAKPGQGAEEAVVIEIFFFFLIR